MRTTLPEERASISPRPRLRRNRPRAPRGTVRLPPSTTRWPRPVPEPLTLSILVRRYGAMALVLGSYVVSALIVPTMAPVPVGDDWVYARSVEILLREGELRVLDLSVVTLVFQVVWGALFAAVFGISFGALRLSTVVLTLLGGWACYGICRELGVDRARSALGAAAYLFNPLAFVLGFTFMTDPQFAALLVIATLGYVRGLRPDRPEGTARRALIGGSVAAGLAFLVRQQGALIPVAVVTYLLLARRLPRGRSGVELVARVVAAPVVAVVGYYLWLFFVHGVPDQQESFTRKVRDAGWDELWLLAQRLTFIEAMYLGFFALPLAAAALTVAGRLPRFRSPLGWALVGTWAGLVVAGLVVFGDRGQRLPRMPRMPYVPQYVGPNGLGPTDLHGGRPWLVGWAILDWVTGICAVASLVFVLVLCRRVGRSRRPVPEGHPTRAGAGLVLAVGLWQVVGVLPPSVHFRNWIVSVDRYLLPLLPIAVCLGLWAMRGLRAEWLVAWVVVVAFALFSVAGTRDFLVFQQATWDLARWAVDSGVPLTKLDGGAAWDGYYLYEYSREQGIDQQTRGGPWWTDLFGPATDSSYVVATREIEGYDVVGQVEYDSWLEDDPTHLFLLRRQGVPGPP